MDEKIEVKDKRRKNFYIVHNVVFDNIHDLVELAVYTHLVRYSNVSSESFFSVRSIAKRYKVGKTRVRDAIKSLEAKGFIEVSSKTTKVGCKYVELLDLVHTDPGWVYQDSGWVCPDPGVGLRRPQTRYNNNTNKQDTKTRGDKVIINGIEYEDGEVPF